MDENVIAIVHSVFLKGCCSHIGAVACMCSSMFSALEIHTLFRSDVSHGASLDVIVNNIVGLVEASR